MSNEESGKRHDGEKHRGPASSSPYPMSRLAPAHDLVDVAREIQRADAILGSVATGKLALIADQIRALQEQARRVLLDTQRDAELHRAKCQFVKRVGQTYHLYKRASGDLYFSLLSPEDWSGSPPDLYDGSYRLEADMSWTPAADAELRETRAQSVRALLGQ
jgi:Protein of unknown function (DUF2452)